MHKLILGCALVAIAATGLAGHHESKEAAATPDEDMMQAMAMAAAPGDAHAQLAGSTGTFAAEMTFFLAPGAPPATTTMSVERHMDLDGRVLVEKWSGEFMGQSFSGLGRTGYDNVTQQYWSTWTDNMSTGVLIMYGNGDGARKEFSGEGTSPITGQKYRMRSVATYPDADTETMEMYEDHGDGERMTMSVKLTRT